LAALLIEEAHSVLDGDLFERGLQTYDQCAGERDA
jgi:hypothetical protein